MNSESEKERNGGKEGDKEGGREGGRGREEKKRSLLFQTVAKKYAKNATVLLKSLKLANIKL